jgi:AraC-like DNA-binding protein
MSPVAAIAASLGFSEPTGFHEFFVRLIRQRRGESPNANRR